MSPDFYQGLNMNGWMLYISVGALSSFIGFLLASMITSGRFKQLESRIASLEKRIAVCLEEMSHLAAGYRAIVGAVLRATTLEGARAEIANLNETYAPRDGDF